MKNSFHSISKEMAYILRHHPEERGITLDAKGWADVEALLNSLHASGCAIDRAGLEQLVKENDKQRFAFSADRTKIRASQGHSFPVELDLEPVTPPEVLFHGTAARFLDSIRQTGLEKRKRQYVHLSPNVETAVKVGVRHGKPVILRVLASKMTADGFVFYRSANGVWLTESVPVSYLEFPDSGNQRGEIEHTHNARIF